MQSALIQTLLLFILLSALFISLALGAPMPTTSPSMLFSDTTRLGRPFAKDPAVVHFHGKYFLYYSIPSPDPKLSHGFVEGWGIGIATSDDLIHWQRVGELPSVPGVDQAGFAAPGARVINGKLHLFYQTYGNGEKDAICHATSNDGIHFDRDPSNPVFHPTGPWTCGRAIDADVIEFKGKVFLYCATRDPHMKIQMITGASADPTSPLGKTDWHQLPFDGPLLKPEMPWEQDCLEAPATGLHDGKLYLFYGGAYNNRPQQIGCAVSDDGIHFHRVSNKPLLPNGPPGSWNSSESGHPFCFTDDDGQTYLFYQGNNDHGKTWSLSCVKVQWNGATPVLTP
jgi:hypothetical protein